MSGRKNNLYQYKILNGVSLGASFSSVPTNIEIMDNISYQMNITTADAIGSFTIEVSDDYNQDSQGNVITAGNWITLPISDAMDVAGASDLIMFDGNQISQPWIRLKYTRTSGTGSVTAYVTGKML